MNICTATQCNVWDILHEILIEVGELGEDSNPDESDILYAGEQYLKRLKEPEMTSPVKIRFGKRADSTINMKQRSNAINEFFATYPIGSKVFVKHSGDWWDATVKAHKYHTRGYSGSIDVFVTTTNKTLHILWGSRNLLSKELP